ncbi:Alpha/Beta hydrolase protein [Apiospora rasikravindrae]|uniref:Alpha/Beta hydrolase protein n=1 Tax=Apiospora rasikravindrae TaxID=990691 RepID=A0ABR1U7F7_9PEZI
MASNEIPMTGGRTTLASSVGQFLKDNPSLHLGGQVDFHEERRHHLEVFGFHNLPQEKQGPIGRVEFAEVRGRHGTVPVSLFYPRNFEDSRRGMSKGDIKTPALVYMHGGGYTVGSVDEFENGLRLLAEKANMITIGVEYHLAPEFPFPHALDDYADVLVWAQGEEGSSRGIDSDRVIGGGDSAGGNMTAALALRLEDEGKKQMKGQLLLYPEARLPFDTPAASENNSGYYLECNGIFSFADHYLPRAPNEHYPPAHRYISPGMQKVEDLKGLPRAALFTCGFDPLRDVGVEYGHKLQKAGTQVDWHHYPDLTHGFLQMAPWSEEAMKAVAECAEGMKKLVL